MDLILILSLLLFIVIIIALYVQFIKIFLIRYSLSLQINWKSKWFIKMPVS